MSALQLLTDPFAIALAAGALALGAALLVAGVSGMAKAWFSDVDDALDWDEETS